jgi:hypothetical protein
MTRSPGAPGRSTLRPCAAVLLLLCLSLTLAAGLVACTGAATLPADTPLPEATATPTTDRVALGAVRAAVNARCDLNQLGAEMTITYSAQAAGGAQLSRVRLSVNGRVVEDTGAIVQNDLARVMTVPVSPGSLHFYQVVAEASERPVTVARDAIRCPAASPGFRA